jgi:hypothetical protein
MVSVYQVRVLTEEQVMNGISTDNVFHGTKFV